MKDLSTVLVRNALFGGGARVATLAVGLFMTPYLLGRLGPEGFGVWALVTVVTGTIGLLDFSFKTSFVKHLAEVFALEDRRELGAIASTGFFFYLVFAAGVALLFWVSRQPLLALLRIPESLATEADQVFLIGVAGYLVSSVLSVFPAVCDARQRMDITNSLGVGALLIGAGLTVAAVEKGLGVRGVALAQLAGIVLFHVASFFAARKLAGPLEISPRRVSRRCFSKMFPFGVKLHLSSACGAVNRHLDKFLLSRWAGLPFVSSYEIALRVAGNVGTFQPYLAAALLPASSHLSATGERERLLAMYRKASRYLFLVGIPPFVYLAAHGEVVVAAWLGYPEPKAAAVLAILTAGYMVNALSNAMAFVCQGIGRPGIQAEQSALQLGANVALSVLLLWAIGPLGAPAGTSLAFLLGAGYFAWRFHRQIELSSWALLREAALVPLAASLLGVLAAWLLTAGMAAEARGAALLKLVASGVVFVAVSGGVCWLLGFIGRSDLAYLRAVFQSGKEQEKT